MLALDGARLRRSLAMTKQDCSDRYQLPQPVLAQGEWWPLGWAFPGRCWRPVVGLGLV